MDCRKAFPLYAMAFALACSASLRALEPDAAKIRISVKRVLSAGGGLPAGRWGSAAEITGTINKCNAALVRSGSRWVLDLAEIVDSQAASGFYTMAAHQITNLESAAKANRAGYLWRDNAVNIYVVDEITDAGGVCSFPPNAEVIALNSRSILGGSEGWLHEMGHYFNLIHPHEGDLVADTMEDTPPPDPFDCGLHDQNFINFATSQGAPAGEINNVLHNIMSYHCDPQILTPLQLIRMHRALLDYRLKVREPLAAGNPPSAEIRLPPEASGGVLAWQDGGVKIALDGSASTDGDGGAELTCKWTLLSGPAGGASFLTPAAGWERGCSGIGYGDDDDMTELNDMRGRYLTVYMTRAFDLADPARVSALSLDVTYDDGFAAYLNGAEVARRNLPAGAGKDTPASATVDEMREILDLSAFRGSLVKGRNRLSIEIHNADLNSSDLSLHPVLGAQIQGQGAKTLIPSRAVWFYQKGSQGSPPAGWRDPDFDPAASQIQVSFSRPGAYLFQLLVNDGLPPSSTDSAEVEIQVVEEGYIRGDANSNGEVDIADAVFTLLHLFLGSVQARCEKAMDSNDSGEVDLADAIDVLAFLFAGGSPIPPPYPRCGDDPTQDALSCAGFALCKN